MIWTMTALATVHAAREGFAPAEMLGYLPAMVTPASPDGAVVQFDRNYPQGGGWHDSHGFTLDGADTEAPTLNYEGDPPMRCIASTALRDERIYLFEASYVAVVQPDGSMRVARMD